MEALKYHVLLLTLGLAAAVLNHLLEYLHFCSFPEVTDPAAGLNVLDLLQLRSLVQQYQLAEALPLVNAMFTDTSRIHGKVAPDLDFLSLINAMSHVIGPDTYRDILWRWPDAALVLQQFKAAGRDVPGQGADTPGSSAETAAAEEEGGKADRGEGNAAGESKAAEEAAADTPTTAAAAAEGGHSDLHTLSLSPDMALAGVQLFLQLRSCRPWSEEVILSALLQWVRAWNAAQTRSADGTAAIAGAEQQVGGCFGSSSANTSSSSSSATPAVVQQLLQQVQWHKVDPAAIRMLGAFGDVLDVGTWAGMPRRKQIETCPPMECKKQTSNFFIAIPVSACTV